MASDFDCQSDGLTLTAVLGLQFLCKGWWCHGCCCTENTQQNANYLGVGGRGGPTDEETTMENDTNRKEKVINVYVCVSEKERETVCA